MDFVFYFFPSSSTFTIHRYASSLFLLFTLATRCELWSLSSLLPFLSKTVCRWFSVNVCSKLVPRAYLAIKDANPRLVLSPQESVSQPYTLASSSSSLSPLIEMCTSYGTFYAAAHSNLREAAGSSHLQSKCDYYVPSSRLNESLSQSLLVGDTSHAQFWDPAHPCTRPCYNVLWYTQKQLSDNRYNFHEERTVLSQPSHLQSLLSVFLW